jgi:hypothetical protein
LVYINRVYRACFGSSEKRVFRAPFKILTIDLDKTYQIIYLKPLTMKPLSYTALLATALLFLSFVSEKRPHPVSIDSDEKYYVVYAHCACTPDKDGKFDKYLFVSEVVYGKSGKLRDAFNDQVKTDVYNWGQIPLAETWWADDEESAYDKRREKIAEYKSDGYQIRHVALYPRKR